MGYGEILIKLKSEKAAKKLYKKVQAINEKGGDISFFAAIEPKKTLDTTYEWAGGKFGDVLKKDQLYAWIGASKDFIRHTFQGIEVSPGIDQYLNLDSNGCLKEGFWENDFVKHFSVNEGILSKESSKENVEVYETIPGYKYDTTKIDHERIEYNKKAETLRVIEYVNREIVRDKTIGAEPFILNQLHEVERYEKKGLQLPLENPKEQATNDFYTRDLIAQAKLMNAGQIDVPNAWNSVRTNYSVNSTKQPNEKTTVNVLENE